MMIRTKLIGCGFNLFLYLFFLPHLFLVLAENSFVTIINPVRISAYNSESEESLKAEYFEIQSRDLPATWLVTFDVLQKKELVTELKSFDQKQEIGLFLEITPNFATAAGVQYHNTGSWHHADAVFLSGYTQAERIKLLKTIFETFKQVFGFYPKSVGSWWTDAFSLSYMKDKYGILANLTCADQFATDNYMIWGTPWQIPYYPSRFHSGIFAVDKSVKLDVVNLQWAPRDPLNGYQSSLFSTQDYLVAGKNLDTAYFAKLVDFYTDTSINGFGQITVGLEADLSAGVYGGEYAKQLELVVNRIQEKGLIPLTMSDFGGWYRTKFPDLSPENRFETGDFLGTGQKIIWYQSPNYRVGVRLADTKAIIFDLRIYGNKQSEPYLTSPNREKTLFVNNFSTIDEKSDPESVIVLRGEAKDFSFEKNQFFHKGKKMIKREEATRIHDENIRGFTSEAVHFFKQKKFPLLLLKGIGWGNFKLTNYLLPEGEVEALNKLKSLPKGKVLVYDTECLYCEYHTQNKPPAFANIRKYVANFSKKKVVQNQVVFTAQDRIKSLAEFKKTKAKYLYLVKFESYIEKIPFSPGDLNLDLVFENANAAIYAVK